MSIFTRADLASLKADRLLALSGYLSNATMSDDYLFQQVLAAEDDLEMLLRIFLSPVEVLAMSTPDSERAALVAAGTRIADDPGYPYDQGLFGGGDWCLTKLRYRPVISITSMTFNYPSPTGVLYTVPPDWIRLDKRAGEIQLVPTSNFLSFPFSSLLLNAINAGQDIPYFLQFRYRAGLANARADHPAAVDLVLKMAVMRIMEGTYVPASSSLSADGLSQSSSLDLSKYQDGIDKRVETLRQRFQGIRIMAM